MKYKTTTLLMLVTAFTFACDRFEKLTSGFPTPPPEIATPTKQLSNLELKPDIELQKQIEAIAAEAKGKVGIAAVVLETGDSASLNADQHFPMQSMYKLPISMAVLHAVDDEKLSIDELIGIPKEEMAPANMYSPLRDKYPGGATVTVRELIEYAVSQSDNTACDVLIRLAGGTDAIQQYLAAVGLKDMTVANPEREIQPNWQLQYANFASPNAAVTLLRNLHEGNGISSEHRAALLKFMTDSTTGPKRLKGLLPAGTAVAHKTGTSGTQNGITAATNDMGIITLPNGKHIAIAVFVSDSPADEKTREAVIAKIAKAVWDRWNDPKTRTPQYRVKGEIDIDISKVKIGASFATVQKILGKPSEIKRGGIDNCVDEHQLTVKYPGLELYLLGKGKLENYTVAYIEVTSGKWSANGVSLGAGVEQILETFGKPFSQTSSLEEQDVSYVIKGNEGWIRFVFKDDKLAYISVIVTLC